MRSAFIAGAAGTAALVAGLLFDAGLVSAHIPSHSVSCDGATITAEAFDAVDTNTATVYIDSTEVFEQTFGTFISETVAVPEDGAVHSVRFVIDVDLADGGEVPAGWELDVTEEVGPCGEVPTTTTTTTTTTEPPTTTTEPPPSSSTSPPSSSTPTTEPGDLSIAAFSPVCLRDAPYVDVTFGDQPEFDGRTATVTFVDLDGNEVETHTTTYQAGALVRFVYPGAEVDANGNPVDWPGWRFDGDEWVVDPTDARLRDGLRVVVEVNPTATGMVEYPPVTPDCDARPPTSSTGGTLPATGSSNSTPTAMIAAAFLVGGLVLVVLARLRLVKE
jgi:LPXTG-motif cell wall-anchored protein